ncbi:MAG: PadR family transcriptional regulator [Acidimicrobiales bacterium]
MEVRERSRGTFDLAEGTVYPALHRLERAGLLESWWVDHEGRRRRVYRLTTSGASALAAQQLEYRRFEKGMRWGLGGA